VYQKEKKKLIKSKCLFFFLVQAQYIFLATKFGIDDEASAPHNVT
jgi:hypothetical protein